LLQQLAFPGADNVHLPNAVEIFGGFSADWIRWRTQLAEIYFGGFTQTAKIWRRLMGLIIMTDFVKFLTPQTVVNFTATSD